MNRLITGKCSFNFLCITATCFMVGYWVYKILKNEDVTLIEYILFENTEKPILPELTLCFLNPFLFSKLGNASSGLSSEGYLKYFRGETDSNERYSKINYEDVTINLPEHLNAIQIFLSSGKLLICNTGENCPYANFKTNYNGFAVPHNELFVKCFGIEINQEYSKDVRSMIVDFKTTLAEELRQNVSVVGLINYPQQLLRSIGSDHFIWANYKDSKNVVRFKINSMEIMRRRSKPNDQCLDEWNYHDDFILNNHIKKVGCRAHYQNLPTEKRECSTAEEMKNSLDLLSKDFPLPCQEMSQLSYIFIDGFTLEGFKEFPLIVNYPDKLRVITQSQAIDAHALISNCGGYIGLFIYIGN